jgi:hypothetical protein
MLKRYKNFVIYGQSSKQKLAGDPAALKIKPRLLNVLALTAGAVSAVLLFSVFFAVLVIPGSIVAYLLWRKLRNLPVKPDDESLTAEYRVIKEENKQ